ncbi:MAG: pirin [Siphonobacter sp.]
MDQQTKAQILLADHRGCSVLGGLRSFHTFNFGRYFDESRSPFGLLQVLNDDSLQAEHSVRITLNPTTEIVLLPIVGGLELQINNEEPVFIESGQLFHVQSVEAATLKITDPYPANEVNFLQLWLSSSQAPLSSTKTETIWFPIDSKNQLHPLFTSYGQTSKGWIGKYTLRSEGVLTYEENTQGLFVFVIQGAFEVQNRLLQPRDGLKLWNLQEALEFEALSEDAILLVVEQQTCE